jgi:hypothetical protein
VSEHGHTLEGLYYGRYDFSREKTQGQALLVGGVGLAGNGIMPTSIFFLRSLSTLRDTRAVGPRPYPVV